MTLPGYRALVGKTISLADEVCAGRLVALGGGGYHAVEVVPLAWAWVLAELGGVKLSDEVPEEWRASTRSLLGVEPPTSMGERDSFGLPAETSEKVLLATAETIEQTRAAVFPAHGLEP